MIRCALVVFFFQAEDGIRDGHVTGVQTCALPIFIFEDQFSVGDYVTISGVEGTVEEIGLRTTKIQSWTGEQNVIPNGMSHKLSTIPFIMDWLLWILIFHMKMISVLQRKLSKT